MTSIGLFPKITIKQACKRKLMLHDVQITEGDAGHANKREHMIVIARPPVHRQIVTNQFLKMIHFERIAYTQFKDVCT